MRRAPTYLLSLAIAIPVVVLLPTVHGRAAVAPHPVAPSIQRLAADLPATPAPRAVGAGPVAGTGPVLAATGFSLVGASWPVGAIPAGAEVQVRTARAGRWSTWATLSPQDEAPDPGSADARSAAALSRNTVRSEALWTGPATAVQTRVLGSAVAAAVTLALVDPGTSAADAPASGGAGAADAAPAQPGIYSRANWGADESLRSRNPGCGTPSYAPTVKVAFVHHTDGTNAYTAAQVPALIRGIYAYHVVAEGWCDIGYNFLVDQFGRVWEGRYGGITRAVIGAHAGGFNTNSTGIAMIGDYTSVTPSAALQAALGRLLAWKLSLTYADPVGATSLVSGGGPDTAHPAGQVVALNVISGHRDADQTSCPGNAGYAILPALRRAVLADTGEGLVAPSIAFSQPQADGPAGASFRAGLLAPSAWSFTVRNAAGAVVRSITGSGAGIAASWNGRSATGARLPPGTYSLTLAAGVARPYSLIVHITGGAADLAVVGPTANGTTQQIQVLGAASGYHAFLAERVTPLAVADPQDWRYLIGPYTAPGAEDLVALHVQDTPSGHVEVFVLSQASSYHAYAAEKVTPLTIADQSQWTFGLASLGGDQQADLFAVRTAGGASGHVELHVLSRASTYHTFSLHAATAYLSVDGQWRVLVGDPAGLGDLTAIRLSGGASGAVEVHRLSAASHWTASTLAVVTPVPDVTDAGVLAGLQLGLGDASGDGVWDLVLADLTDTASGAIEVHALSGATGFHSWAAQRATPLTTRQPPAWAAALAR